ncbi:MAG TPA: TMEM175 family protein [Thermoanaerobaculia bacterium]|jgi:uncharacterized membrane protein
MDESFKFRLRGREVSRVEAFSDVVFGFALTLIVVSLEVPTHFEDLMKMMRGFPAFAICFAMLTWLWHVHHTFFRRYALNDEITITLNTVLLFLVLFYTYPLKFMFSILTGQIRDTSVSAPTLFVIYGLGFAGIFAVYVLMYLHAYRKRDELELNAFELHDTKTAMIMFTSYVGLGTLSAILGATLTGFALNFAGWVYFLLGPVSATIGFRRGAQRHKLQVAYAQTAPNTMQTDAVANVAAVAPR